MTMNFYRIAPKDPRDPFMRDCRYWSTKRQPRLRTYKKQPSTLLPQGANHSYFSTPQRQHQRRRKPAFSHHTVHSRSAHCVAPAPDDPAVRSRKRRHQHRTVSSTRHSLSFQTFNTDIIDPRSPECAEGRPREFDHGQQSILPGSL